MSIKNMIIQGLFIFCLVLAPGYGKTVLAAAPDGDIKVDIPVVLKSAKVLFDIERVSFAGDVPVALHFMDIMANKFAEQGTRGQIIGIFYGEATYLLLSDAAYNARRHVTTGNPYKGLISGLQGLGVQIEVCGTAMKLQNIRNEDLLPDVKVNGGANLRMVQLMQEGFMRLQP
jgi:intracellular sulfur oxidation DsrE/DsrF family protein